MPELPEVEVTRQGIAPHMINKHVTQVNIHYPTLRWPIPDDIKKLEGQEILNVRRRAKYLFIDTAKGTAMVHLGMSGHLSILTNPPTRRKHDHVELWFGEKMCLRYYDPRRFGSWLWLEEASSRHPLLDKLAPEPLSSKFDADYLYHALKGRKRPIKVCLMDQNLVVGVGNIYANEVLFATRIHPQRPACQISRQECILLVEQIQSILRQAIVQGGTTLQDFKQADGKPGYFAQKLTVYGRADENCLSCSHLIERIQLGQRATYFCSRCQK